jgi:hypothetical protein
VNALMDIISDIELASRDGVEDDKIVRILMARGVSIYRMRTCDVTKDSQVHYQKWRVRSVTLAPEYVHSVKRPVSSRRPATLRMDWSLRGATSSEN